MNVLRTIGDALEAIPAAASRKTIEGVEAVGGRLFRDTSSAGAEARIRNTAWWQNTSTGNYKHIEMQRATYRNQSLSNRVLDEGNSARYVTPEDAVLQREAGGNIFEIEGWGPTGRGSDAYIGGSADAPQSYVSMNDVDARAFNDDFIENAPTRGGVFLDWVSGKNMQRIKTPEEVEMIKNNLTGRNTYGNQSPGTILEDIRERSSLRTEIGQGTGMPEGGVPASEVVDLGNQASGFYYPEVKRELSFIDNPIGPNRPGGGIGGGGGIDAVPQRAQIDESIQYIQGTMDTPIDPRIFYDDVSQAKVLGSRAAWIAGTAAGVAGISSIVSGNVQGEDEQLNNVNPSMIGGQGMQGRSF